jgi:hypothetical protein
VTGLACGERRAGNARVTVRTQYVIRYGQASRRSATRHHLPATNRELAHIEPKGRSTEPSTVVVDTAACPQCSCVSVNAAEACLARAPGEARPGSPRAAREAPRPGSQRAPPGGIKSQGFRTFLAAGRPVACRPCEITSASSTSQRRIPERSCVARAAREATEQLTLEGTPVCYVRSSLVPEDETVLPLLSC